MKKSLLAFFVMAAMALTSTAGVNSSAPGRMASIPLSNDKVVVGPLASSISAGTVVAAPAKSAEETPSLDFTLSYDPYSALSLNGSLVPVLREFALAFEMTAENASFFAGNTLTSINVCTGVNQNTGKNRITSGKVFITYDLQAEPVYSQNCTLGTDAFTYYNITLDTPFEIEAGKAFYVCFSAKKSNSADYYIPIDAVNHSGEEGGWVAYKKNSNWAWLNIAEDYGYVCLGATIEGESLPVNRANLVSAALTSSISKNQPFDLDVVISNFASNPVENVEIAVTMGDGEPMVGTYTLEAPAAFGKPVVVTVPGVVCPEAGLEVPMTVSVNKVNGVENSASERQINQVVPCFSEYGGFDRNVVSEEGTGTWCGWCPLGFNTMEYIRETYTDGSFIPVAVHNDNEMECTSYNAFLNNLSGLPGAMINREQDVDPRDQAAVINLFNEYRQFKTVARVDLSCCFTDDTKTKIQFDANSQFAFDTDNSNGTYRLSFAIVEDEVGPYNQTNNYSGRSDDCGGWERKPNPASVIYNDVAREVATYNGLANSVPASISAYVYNPYSYTMTIPSTVSNPDNLSAIAYLLNTKTGAIENAVVVRPAQFVTTGIDAVVDSASAVTVAGGVGAINISGDYTRAEVYSISGMKVAQSVAGSSIELPSGLYIVRVDGLVKKVLVK